MKLLGHLLASDLRRFGLLLIGWLLVVAASAIVDGARPMLAGAPAIRETVGMLGTLLWLAKLLLMFVLVALVVQAHPLVGSDAFWMTRPIPPRTLLLSKAILPGLVVVAAPAFAEAAVMATYDVPAAGIAAVATQNALFRACGVVVLMAAAAVTRNLPRFALLCGGALVAFAVLIGAMTAMLLARINDSPFMSGGAGTDEPTSGIVLIVLASAAGVALLAVQYRTRSRMRSIPIGAAGLVLAFIVASAWPWRILAVRVQVPSWAAGQEALRLGASAETVQLEEEMPWSYRRSAWNLARARVRVAGIEPGWSADVAVLQGELQLDGETSLASAYAAHPSAVPFEGDKEHPTRTVVRRLLGVGRVVDSAPPHDSAIVLFVRDSDVRRFAPATGTYRGRFQVVLSRHDLDATLPLRHGSGYQKGAYRLVIDAVERTASSVSILARESDATSILDRQPTRAFSFYLRNQRADEAVQGAAHDLPDDFFLGRFLPFGIYGASTSGFRVRNLLIRFPPIVGAHEEPFSIDDDWVDAAELVVVRATREGSVERTLTIADFPLRIDKRTTASRLRADK